jgi:proline utilization trans-activator
VQHHLDPGDFSKRIAVLYSDLRARRTSAGVFYLNFLLVMAIGELLQGPTEGNEELPGARYYQEALNRLPGFSALRNYGVVAVEIMSLIAFYLQCADSKEDAYVYVSRIRHSYVTRETDFRGKGRGRAATGHFQWHGSTRRAE